MQQAATVPTASLIAMIVTLIVMIGSPIVAGIISARGRKTNAIAVIAGIVSFTVMQLVIRIQILGALGKSPAFLQFATENRWLYMAILAFTAALFEGTGRLLTARYIVKPTRYTAGNALMHGVGHGGIESITLGATSYVTNIVLAIMINTGAIGSLSAQLPLEQLTVITSQLVNTPVWLFLISGLERAMTVCFHIGMSVLAFHALKNRSIKSVLLMLLMHTAVDFIVPSIVSFSSMSLIARTVLGEGIVLLFAIASLLIAAKLIKGWEPKQEKESLHDAAVREQAQEIL